MILKDFKNIKKGDWLHIKRVGLYEKYNTVEKYFHLVKNVDGNYLTLSYKGTEKDTIYGIKFLYGCEYVNLGNNPLAEED